jgi:hypothetical protein
MEKRFIGIDLHRNQFTCCIRLENERTYVSKWKLADLAKWVKKLRPNDEWPSGSPATRDFLRRGGAACRTRGGSRLWFSEMRI